MQSAFDIARSFVTTSSLKKNLITPKSLSFNYLLYRFARPLLKVRYKLFKWRNPQVPWTTQASIKTFRKILTKNMIGFEYGSGNSTVFFAKHLKHLTSVEHNQDWFNIVKGNLEKFGLTNVDYHFIPMGKKEDKEYSFYQDFTLTENDFQIRTEYHDYFSFIKKYPDNHFDFIIVDGRARVECCLNAIGKLKSAGIFVLDNSDRGRYKPVFKVLENWKQVTTTTGLFDTTIWFKP
jgi:hypothetical protein